MSALLLVTLSILSTADTPEVTNLIEQLASPEQTERDAAANRLREIFLPAPRTNWEPLLKKLKIGLTKKEVRAFLTPQQREDLGGLADGGSHLVDFRLDHTWVLRCTFRNDGNLLLEAKLQVRLQSLWIAPPADFTGPWVSYFVNGQPSHEIHYRDGKYHGQFTANYSTGKKSYVQNYGPDGAEGEDIGYFPSGKISYRGHYSKGKPIGVWTHYNEQGEVTSTQVY